MGIIFLIIMFGLIGLAGLALWIFSPKVRPNSDDVPGKVIGGIITVLMGIALFLTFFIGGMQSVPVKSLGVPMAFGTVTGAEMGPGLHFTFQPWISVVPVDETVQTTTFEQGSDLPGTKPCDGSLPVRIGGQQTACGDATIQWQIRPSAASSLYQNYANQGPLMQTITDAVVIREFKQVVNQQVGDYNPITDVENVSGTNTATSQFTNLSSQIQSLMQKDIGSRIEVKSVFIPKLTYDPAVEKALQSIQQANANFAISTENVKVNHEKSLAFQKLGDPTLSQLVAQCLTEAGSNAGQCIPGATSKLALTGK